MNEFDQSNEKSLIEIRANFTREFERFKIWVGNTGAHRKGQSSLDFRLRDASHISETVLKLLKRLQSSVQEACQMIASEGRSFDQLSESDSDGELDSDQDLVWSIGSEIKEICAYVQVVTISLLRLSMTIENPAPQGRYHRAQATDTSPYEASDIEHVRSKFPNAAEWLIKRLGQAISTRRQFFTYSESHRSHLKSDLLTIIHGDNKRTIVSSLLEHMKSIVVSKDASEIDDHISKTSFATLPADSDQLRVPPFPNLAPYGEEFECPFCCYIVSIHDWKDWKRHVFDDLQPYICVMKDCVTPNRMFAHLREWDDHLRTHGYPQPNKDITCPLCMDSFLSIRAWEKHVGREMQQLALFALPKRSHGNGTSDNDNAELEATSSAMESSEEELEAEIEAEIEGEREIEMEGTNLEMAKERAIIGEPVAMAENEMAMKRKGWRKRKREREKELRELKEMMDMMEMRWRKSLELEREMKEKREKRKKEMREIEREIMEKREKRESEILKRESEIRDKREKREKEMRGMEREIMERREKRTREILEMEREMRGWI